jgi:hypothetical protein
MRVRYLLGIQTALFRFGTLNNVDSDGVTVLTEVVPRKEYPIMQQNRYTRQLLSTLKSALNKTRVHDPMRLRRR